MNVTLYTNHSENNTLGKSLTTRGSKTCVAKNAISVERPVIILEEDNLSGDINYAYIDSFNRFYFIDDITHLTGNRYQLTLSVDVLESFATDVRALSCIVEKQRNIGNLYYDDGSFVTLAKESKQIVNFPYGLLDTGKYILICAGG